MSRKKNTIAKLKSLLEIRHIIVRAEKSNHWCSNEPFTLSQNGEKKEIKTMGKKTKYIKAKVNPNTDTPKNEAR